MKNINYKSDFDLMLRLRDATGNEIAWPDFDWEALFYTSNKLNRFEASCVGGECVNCFNDNGKIHVVANNHKLAAGKLHVELSCEFPNDIYPDGSRRLVTVDDLGITLMSGNADDELELEAEVIIPFIKGDKGEPFRVEDLTEEDIEQLKEKLGTDEALNKLDDDVTNLYNENDRRDNLISQLQNEVEANVSNITQLGETTFYHSTLIRSLQSEVAENKNSADENADFMKGEIDRNATNITVLQSQMATANEDMDEMRGTDERFRSQISQLQSEMATNAEGLDFFNGTVERHALNISSLQSKQVLLETGLANLQTETETSLSTKQNNLSVSDDFALSDSSELSLTDMAKKRLFIDLWKEACGKWGTYNAETGFFELNGLTDITYEEAIKIYRAGDIRIREIRGLYAGINIRTNLPSSTGYGNNIGYSSQGVTVANSTLGGVKEILNLCSIRGDENNNFYFSSDSKTNASGLFSAKKIIGIINLQVGRWLGNEWFIRNTVTESVKVKVYLKDNGTFTFRLTNVNAESVRFLIENANLDNVTTSCAIQVEKTVYTKLTDENNTEWHQILLDAAEKNISFVSA